MLWNVLNMDSRRPSLCGAAMESVSEKERDAADSSDSDDRGDDAATKTGMLTWPPQAADLLLYTLTNDPSIRARRAAMQTLKAAQVQHVYAPPDGHQLVSMCLCHIC